MILGRSSYTANLEATPKGGNARVLPAIDLDIAGKPESPAIALTLYTNYPRALFPLFSHPIYDG